MLKNDKQQIIRDNVLGGTTSETAGLMNTGGAAEVASAGGVYIAPAETIWPAIERQPLLEEPERLYTIIEPHISSDIPQIELPPPPPGISEKIVRPLIELMAELAPLAVAAQDIVAMTMYIPPIPPAVGYRATSINEMYSINLDNVKNFVYNVGRLTDSPPKDINIKNKCVENSILVQLFLPAFLQTMTGETEFTIPPLTTQNIAVGIRERNALSAVFQKLYDYSESVDAYVNVLDVIGPVLVVDNL